MLTERMKSVLLRGRPIGRLLSDTLLHGFVTLNPMVITLFAGFTPLNQLNMNLLLVCKPVK